MKHDPRTVRRARELRQNLAPAEKILWKNLRSRNFADLKFRRQYEIEPYIADFYCAAAKVIVELDGQTHFGADSKDRRRQTELEKRGFKVLRFWNSQIYEQLESVLKNIWNECDARIRELELEKKAQADRQRQPLTPDSLRSLGPLPGGERDCAIEILFSDECLLAINKPAGFTVHDAPGMSISVMRLLREQHGLSDLTPIHRLDKDASGVLLFAKTKAAASALQRKWETVEKTYVALCENAPPQKSGTIDAPILEHQTGKPERLENALKYFRKTHPKIKLPPLPPPKTSSVHPAGRPSQTRYRVLEQFMTPRGTWSLLEVSPQQGRMHQIRVHLSYLGCALAIDPLYGKKEIADLPALTRVPLHAAKLVITHRGKTLTFDAPLAQDISRAIEDLKIASRMTGQLPG